MLKEELKRRELPQLLKMNGGTECTPELWGKRRKEILNILKDNIYGHTPEPPNKVIGAVSNVSEYAFAGKVIQQLVYIKFDTPGGDFVFPMHLFLPKNKKNVPAFVHIAFRSEIPDRYIPIEEILDNGFALAFFEYNNVTKDSADGIFSQDMARKYFDGRQRQGNEWGRIGMWAFAASRVLDYLLTLEEIDHKHISVIGHSRLGKTALWCTAQDERFFMGISNNSGLAGAALSNRKNGTAISDFIRHGFWDWFCENYKQYENQEENMPFDQHFLLAASAPRHIYVSSAERNPGAYPKSEFLSCYAANEVYNLLGYDGLVTDDVFPTAGTNLHNGQIGYHIRTGTHFLSRYDWNRFMEFIKQKIK